MTYSGGYITVPRDGLYYIYTQQYFDPQSGQTVCGFRIYLNSQHIDIVYQVYPSPNNNHEGSRYSGLLKIVNKGDRLSVKFTHTCYYHNPAIHTLFGAFRLA